MIESMQQNPHSSGKERSRYDVTWARSLSTERGCHQSRPLPYFPRAPEPTDNVLWELFA